MVELLLPAGDFESAKSAIQNGADSIYFGSKNFSARSFAQNFDDNQLKEIIEYSKLRNIKTYLTLNTLLKDDELEDALDLVNYAYLCGIDAIIVQDIGFATLLLKTFPNLKIHASTQMTVNNLEGAKFLESLGFSRIVLARELSLSEIKFIASNINIETEVFCHGALCVATSGQCLFSSLVGGRSANRGKCAGPCRKKYKLIDDTNSIIEKGYLLSTKDIETLNLLPELVNTGVTSLKIEGRMKSPIYTGTTARIYKKYLHSANKMDYVVDNCDLKNLLCVYNRGGNSYGHLKPNDNLTFRQMPNNSGLFLGKIERYSNNRYICVKLNEDIHIGDKISIENIDGSYTVSEIVSSNNLKDNLEYGKTSNCVNLGRIKGDIKLGAKVFKIQDKSFADKILSNVDNENRRIPFDLNIKIKKGKNIVIDVLPSDVDNIFSGFSLTVESDIVPIEAKNKPVTQEYIKEIFTKTNNYPFYFSNFNIILDDDCFITKISKLNSLRRTVYEKILEYGISKIKRSKDDSFVENAKNLLNLEINKNEMKSSGNSFDKTISIYFKKLSGNIDYLSILNDSNFKNLESVYFNLFDIFDPKNLKIIKDISNIKKVFIAFPVTIKPNFVNLILNKLREVECSIDISGFVLSNISNFNFVNKLAKKNYELIANYNLNITNSLSSAFFSGMNISKLTLNPELDLSYSNYLVNNINVDFENIVYGNLDLMVSNYCFFNNSNYCVPDCKMFCKDKHKYYIKDELGNAFRIVPNSLECLTTICNSKCLSIEKDTFNCNSVRIDILDETQDEIKNILETVSSGKRFEGKQFTNGNLNRFI